LDADVWMANVDMKVECNWQFSLYGLPIRSCGTSWLQVGLAEKGAETALHKHQTLKHNYAVLSTQKWPHSDIHHTKNRYHNWLPTDFISSPLTVGVDKDAKWVGFRGRGEMMQQGIVVKRKENKCLLCKMEQWVGAAPRLISESIQCKPSPHYALSSGGGICPY
jgi:hypothetical protein